MRMRREVPMQNPWRWTLWIAALLLLHTIASARQPTSGSKTFTFDNDAVG